MNSFQFVFSKQAIKDIEYLKKSGNKILLSKINTLLEEISNQPFKGLGKPEPLKHDLSGCWSRRINLEHRLIYELQKDSIIIHSVLGHY